MIIVAFVVGGLLANVAADPRGDLVERWRAVEQKLRQWEKRQRVVLGPRAGQVVKVHFPDDGIEELEHARQTVTRGRISNPKLTEAEIAAFERRHHVTLPADYRAFLSTVGNGGEGPPFYGLLALGEIVVGNEFPWTTAEELRLLARPFPLTEQWLWEGETETRAQKVRRAALRQGALLLGTEGCGETIVLIVTGRARGQIWSITDVGAGPVEKQGFLVWYEAWLARHPWWWTQS